MRNQRKSTDLGCFIQTFKSILLHLPVPCYILDLEGTIVFSNDETIQLTEYQRETDFKMSFFSQLDDEYIDKTIEHFKTVLTGERLQFQIEIRHQNGESIPVNIILIPLEIRGLVQGISGFILEESEKSAVIQQPSDPDYRTAGNLMNSFAKRSWKRREKSSSLGSYSLILIGSRISMIHSVQHWLS
ncbi:PAS domain S-box protein [Bacillus sp. ISL-7]|uniref:PAS domain S-box protein n=1 Tax=Bacillus sp. ISL-7 TaxID=2819136 RepID=UPI001BE6D7CE|nr:PAS domain S-box protein [Bacillus sp. ISL-7]MBT2734401.1 PAS domain S-box protein [Bacillus sp. ISL-7]